MDSKQEAPSAPTTSVVASMATVGSFPSTVVGATRTAWVLSGGDVLSIITFSIFEWMLQHQTNAACQADHEVFLLSHG